MFLLLLLLSVRGAVHNCRRQAAALTCPTRAQAPHKPARPASYTTAQPLLIILYHKLSCHRFSLSLPTVRSTSFFRNPPTVGRTPSGVSRPPALRVATKRRAQPKVEGKRSGAVKTALAVMLHARCCTILPCTPHHLVIFYSFFTFSTHRSTVPHPGPRLTPTAKHGFLARSPAGARAL